MGRPFISPTTAQTALRRKNGTAEWIWGEKCPIKDGMSTAEINAACKAVCNSLLKTNTKLAGYIWESDGFWTEAGLKEWYAEALQDLFDFIDPARVHVLS